MLRVAVTGCGAWGQNHVRALVAEGAEVAYLCDVDAANLAQANLLAPSAKPATLHTILTDPTVQAVVLATPAATHTTLACQVLDAGKFVLVEKPIALTHADALRLATHRFAARLMAGHLMLYHPVFLRVAQLVESGELGPLHYLHATRVNLGRLRADENVLWSFGPHDLAMIDFLLGKLPVSVAARGQAVLQAGVEDVAFLSMRYATGELAHVHVSWLSPRKERRLTLVGASKMAEFDDVANDKLRVFDKGYDRQRAFTKFDEFLTIRDGDVHSLSVRMEEPLRVQHRHFLDAVANQRPFRTDAASALRVTAVLHAASLSLAQDGQPVPLSIENYK